MSGRVSKSRASRKNATYLKLEKPRFLFLEGWGAPPPRLLAPLRCPLAPPPMTRQRAAPCLPRESIPWPPPRPMGMGARVPTSRRWSAPRCSPPRPRTSSPTLTEGRDPAARTAIFFVVLVEALLPPDPPLLCESRPILLPLLRSAAGGLGSRCRRVRSSGMDVHRLRARLSGQTKNASKKQKSKGKAVLTGRRRGAS
jgi:hypothetical protein